MKKKWTMLLTAPIILIGIMAMGVFPPTALAAITGVTPSGAASGDFIGLDVDVDGSYGVAGAPGADSSGRVYVYKIGTSGTFDQYTEVNHSALASGGDRFGESVAISGDLFIAGAPGYDKAFSGASAVTVGDAGAAFIFRRNASGLWNPLVSPHPYLLATDGSYADSDGFGKAVDTLYTGSGTDYAIVGAPNDAAVATTSGSVYFYSITGTTWAADGQKVYPGDAQSGTPADGGASHYFGGSVSISKGADGNLYAFVGAIGANSSRGAVYVYRRDATLGWQFLEKIVATDAASNDQFGFSVSASGSRLIVGSSKRDESSKTNCGKAYAYSLTSNTFAADGTILAKKFDSSNAIVDDTAAYALFGVDVAVSGDFAIIGAKDYGTAGAYYVYQRTGAATWTLKQRVAPSSPANADFGGSVSIYSGGTSTFTTFVGAPEVGTGDVYTGDQTGGTITSNHFPFISSILDKFVDNTESTCSVDFTVFDVETPADSLMITPSYATVSGDNIIGGTLTVSGSGSSRTLTIPLVSGKRGVARIAIAVKDGANATATTSFLVTLYSPPVISGLGPDPITGLNLICITAKNVPLAIPFAVSDAQDTDATKINLSATAETADIVSKMVFTNGTGNNVTLTVTPATNVTGSTKITVTATDTHGDARSVSFTFIVNGGPEIVSVTPTAPVTGEDTTSGTISVVIRDDQDGTLAVTVTSQDMSKVDDGTGGSQIFSQDVSVFANVSNSVSFTVTPRPNAFGTVGLLITVTDAQNFKTTRLVTLSITQNTSDDPPQLDVLQKKGTDTYETLLPGKTLTIEEDSSTAANDLKLQVWHPDAPAGGSRTVTVTIKSNNTSVVPDNTTTEGYILIGGTPILSNTYSLQATSEKKQFDLRIIPKANSSGTAQISLKVTDGNSSFEDSFWLEVTPKNDPPTISTISDQTVLEDSGTKVVNFTVADAETLAYELDVKATYTDTNGLLSSLTVGGSGTNRTLSFTPAPNANSTDKGTLSVTVTVTDTGVAGSESMSATTSFVITVTSVNDAPQIVDILHGGISVLDSGGILKTVEIDEDTATSVEVKISDPDNAVGFLEMSASGNGSTMLTGTEALVASGYGDTRLLTITPAANTSGEARVTVTVKDPSGATVSKDFILKVNPGNDPPTITGLTDQTVLEDSGAKVVSFTVADAETLASSLTVEAIYTDTNGLLSSLTVGGTGTNRTLTFTPAANANSTAKGTLTVTVKVTDTGLNGANTMFSTASFVITVTSVNDPPKIEDILYLGNSLLDSGTLETVSINEDTLTSVEVKISDPDNSVGLLEMSASGNGSTMLSGAGALVPSGYGSPRLLTITPAADTSGEARVTVTVKDPENAAATADFILKVNATNDPPTVTGLTDQTVLEDSGMKVVNFTIDDAETLASSLLVTASYVDSAGLLSGGVSVGGTGANRTLSFTPAANANSNSHGTATVTVRVTDTGIGGVGPLFTEQSFTITVTPVNDPPKIKTIKRGGTTLYDPTLFSTPQTLTIDEDTVVSDIKVEIEDPDQEQPVHALTLSGASGTTAVIANTGIVATGYTATRDLSLTPVANASGVSLITLTVSDSAPASSTASFILSVTPVNDPPVISPLADVSIDEDTTAGPITVTVTDPEGGTLTLQATSDNPALVNTGIVISPPSRTVTGGSPTTFTLTITPVTDAFGTANITLTASDSAPLAGDPVTFKLTVTNVNDAPTISGLKTIYTTQENQTVFIPVSPDVLTICDSDASYLIIGIATSTTTNTIFPAENLYIQYDQNGDGFTPDEEYPNIYVLTDLASGCQAKPLGLKLVPAQYKNGGPTRFILTVKDEKGVTTTGEFDVQVYPVNNPPEISGTPDTYAYVGQAYTFTPTASDPDGTAVTFSAYIGTSTVVPGSAGWPTWLGFNAATGTLSGAPLDADQGLITGIVISAKDASGLSASLPAFDIQVSKDKKAPVISDVTIPTAPKEDTTFTVTFNLSDNNGDTVTLAVASDTPTLISESKITFSGTGVSTVGSVVTVTTTAGGSPTLVTMTVSPELNASGNAQLTLTATDAPDAMTDTEIISLSVAAQADAPFITGIPLNYTLSLDEDAVDVVAGIIFPDDDANPDDGIFVGDPDGGILTISAESSNDALVADANVKIYAYGSSPGFGDGYMVSVPADGTGVHMTLRIFPTANAVGQTIITVTATDGTTETTSEFLLAISNDNDPPEILSVTIPTSSMPEEGTLLTPFQVRDYDSGETLRFTVSGDPDLALFSQAVFEGTGVTTSWDGSKYIYSLIPTPGTSYTVNLKLIGATNQTGTRNITITVTDKDTQTDTATFPVTISPVNDVPTIDSIANLTIDEDAETKVAFTIHDPDKELLEISVTTTTATLIDATSFRVLVGAAETSYTSPYTAVYLNDTDEYGILKVLFKPVRDAFGTGSITVTVKDQAAVTATRTFSVTITPAQDPPSIAVIDNQTVSEDGTKAVTVTLTEPDGGTVTLYIQANNAAYTPEEVVPNDKSNLAVTAGTGIITSIVNDDVNDRVVVTLTTQPNVAIPLTLTLKPAPDRFTTTGLPIPITLTADDGGGWTAPADLAKLSKSFNLTVTPVNDAPTITTIVGPKITTAATPTTPITFKILDSETPVDSLVVDVTSSNATVVPTNTTNLKVTTIPGDHNRQLVITPAGIVGESTITVKVIDTEGLSASTSFLLRVESGGTRIPVIGEISTPQLMQEGGTLSVDFSVNFPLNMGELVTSVLSVQGSSSKTSLVPNGSPYIVITYQSSSGDTHNYRMTIKPPENVPTQTQETTTITVYAIAENYTQSRAFELKVDPINDAPVFLMVPSSVTTYENVAATFQFQLRDYDGDKVTIYATSDKTTIIPNTSIKINTTAAPVQVTPQADTASVLTLVATPDPSRVGDVVITLKADDGINAPVTTATVTIHILSSGTPRISMIGLGTCPPDQVTTRNTPIYLFLDVADLDGGLLTLGKSSDAPSVVATTGIVYSKDGAAISNILVEDAGGGAITQEVSLTVSPVSNAYGAARVTLTATDSSAKVGTCDFLVTIREIQPGDVNGNGIVDLTDAVLALKVVAGISVSGVTYKADVNDDLRIGMEEVVYILRYVAGL